MASEEFDPERVRKAKAVAAGPLGQEMGKFPLRFARPVFFGQKPSKSEPIRINNGTITFVQFEELLIGITCSHVIDKYKQISRGENCIFQIGHLEFDPLERIIDESTELDLVSIDLNGLNFTQTINGIEIGSGFFVPAYWPPKEVVPGDYVAFGGFPGEWRKYPEWNSIVFDTWSSGGSEVSSVHDQYFICQFKRKYWVESFNYNYREGLDLKKLGGLSGGPVFIHRDVHWDLVGIISEFSEELDLMYIKSVNLISDDGKIRNEVLLL